MAAAAAIRLGRQAGARRAQSAADERDRNRRLAAERRDHEPGEHQSETAADETEQCRGETGEEKPVGDHSRGGEEVVERVGAGREQAQRDRVRPGAQPERADRRVREHERGRDEDDACDPVDVLERRSGELGHAADEPVGREPLRIRAQHALVGKRRRRPRDDLVVADVVRVLLANAVGDRRPPLHDERERGPEPEHGEGRQPAHRASLGPRSGATSANAAARPRQRPAFRDSRAWDSRLSESQAADER